MRTGGFMDISVSIEKDSIAIPIENPFRINLDYVVSRIDEFCASKGAAVSGLDIRGLIQQMTRGIAGCERGCPADAREFVRRGVKGFKLAYVEGGILTATASLGNNKELSIKIFPDF